MHGLARIRDGVKGEKAIIDVEYSGPTAATLPTTFFAKFSIQKLSAMRLLCETSEVSACEALFYTHLAEECRDVMSTPRAFFVDYHEVSGEFCLLSELMPFGEGKGQGALLPLKHRVRDAPSIEEQRMFITSAAALHATFWGATALERGCLRFDATHRRAWTIMQGLSLLGLHHTTRLTLKGRPIPNQRGYVTWKPPEELVGKEGALIRDMPAILTSLCEEVDMTAFGHNDVVTDNAYFVRGPSGAACSFGLFDWQQSSVNSIGQEWAWNWHWLPPEFLDAHESELIDILLEVYASHGRRISRAAFLRHYVLGCAQMYVFSGGGLQPLMGRLHSRGLLEGVAANDERTRDGSLDGELLELFNGAEMTRRTFTNCCNIMRRHGFAAEWMRWRKAHGMSEL